MWPDGGRYRHSAGERRVRVYSLGRSIAWAAAPPVFSFEGGQRYFYSTGKTSKDLYNHEGTSLLSRLTYDDLDAYSIEVFFNAIHNPTGIFVKGLVGAGWIT
ncbi:hypothetical protein BAE40_29735 [Mesorhizobium loti]|nr:hypothetical protein BAE40_29735 [Mesorhizobium loti]